MAKGKKNKSLKYDIKENNIVLETVNETKMPNHEETIEDIFKIDTPHKDQKPFIKRKLSECWGNNKPKK